MPVKNQPKKNPQKAHWIFGGGVMHPRPHGNYNMGNKGTRPKPMRDPAHMVRANKTAGARKRADEDIKAGRSSSHTKSPSKPRPRPKRK